MIIKMVNEFKLTVVHVAHPNPMQICACGQKKCGKSGLGRGRRAIAGREPLGRGPAFSKTPRASDPGVGAYLWLFR